MNSILKKLFSLIDNKRELKSNSDPIKIEREVWYLNPDTNEKYIISTSDPKSFKSICTQVGHPFKWRKDVYSGLYCISSNPNTNDNSNCEEQSNFHIFEKYKDYLLSNKGDLQISSGSSSIESNRSTKISLASSSIKSNITNTLGLHSSTTKSINGIVSDSEKPKISINLDKGSEQSKVPLKIELNKDKPKLSLGMGKDGDKPKLNLGIVQNNEKPKLKLGIDPNTDKPKLNLGINQNKDQPKLTLDIDPNEDKTKLTLGIGQNKDKPKLSLNIRKTNTILSKPGDQNSISVSNDILDHSETSQEENKIASVESSNSTTNDIISQDSSIKSNNSTNSVVDSSDLSQNTVSNNENNVQGSHNNTIIENTCSIKDSTSDSENSQGEIDKSINPQNSNQNIPSVPPPVTLSLGKNSPKSDVSMDKSIQPQPPMNNNIPLKSSNTSNLSSQSTNPPSALSESNKNGNLIKPRTGLMLNFKNTLNPNPIKTPSNPIESSKSPNSTHEEQKITAVPLNNNPKDSNNPNDNTNNQQVSPISHDRTSNNSIKSDVTQSTDSISKPNNSLVASLLPKKDDPTPSKEVSQTSNSPPDNSALANPNSSTETPIQPVKSGWGQLPTNSTPGLNINSLAKPGWGNPSGSSGAGVTSGWGQNIRSGWGNTAGIANNSGWGSTNTTSGWGSTNNASGWSSTNPTSGWGSSNATSGWGSSNATSGWGSGNVTGGWGSTSGVGRQVGSTNNGWGSLSTNPDGRNQLTDAQIKMMSRNS